MSWFNGLGEELLSIFFFRDLGVFKGAKSLLLTDGIFARLGEFGVGVPWVRRSPGRSSFKRHWPANVRAGCLFWCCTTSFWEWMPECGPFDDDASLLQDAEKEKSRMEEVRAQDPGTTNESHFRLIFG